MVGFNKPYPCVDRPQSEGRPNLERGWKGKQKKKKIESSPDLTAAIRSLLQTTQ